MYAPYRVIKNAPLDLWWFAVDNNGAVSTGGTGPAATRSLDGAAFGATTNAPVETPAAGGLWKLIMAVADMAADIIAVKPTYTGPRTPEPIILIPEPALDSGVAQAGSTTSITLRAGAPAFSLVGSLIEIVRGTGNTQRPRFISAYNTGTKVATPRPDWSTPPDNTSVYKVTPLFDANIVRIDGVEFPAQAMSELYNIGYKPSAFLAGSTTTVLQTLLTGLGANQLVGMGLIYLGAAQAGIMRPITAYNTTTGQISVYPPFAVAPVLDERFAVLGTTG